MDREFKLTTPVAFVFFNRLDTTKKAFGAIRCAKPQKLYLIADAPRSGKENDQTKVAETRRFVEESIDWDCEVYRNYAEENMGCRSRIASGLDWVFESEEKAIIIEDDIVPVQDFFRFCQEMLEYYQDDPRVMMVSGTNLIRNYNIPEAYAFTCFSSIWGWATWKRAWEKMDVSMRDWPEQEKKKTLRYVAKGPSYLWIYWNFKYSYRGETNSWGYPWSYARFKNHGLGIVPKENLVNNIGTDHEDSTHMHGEVTEDFSCGSVAFPIISHPEVKRNMEYDKAYIRKNYNSWKAIAEWIRKAFFYALRKTGLKK